MKKYSNYKSNYDKYPVVQVSETSENVCWQGWPEIVSQLNKSLENVHKPVRYWLSNVIKVFMTRR